MEIDKADWGDDEPCPLCGGADITEWEMGPFRGVFKLSWECRDCGALTSWRERLCPIKLSERMVV